jgi:uncharacterized ferritin-like protein (DUF455 family)
MNDMSHSIQHVAEQLIWGQTLEDKLRFFQIHGLHPNQKYKSKFCELSSLLPSRPPKLRFSSKSRIDFPKNFEDKNARGIAMHFFANHELLAIELMALCLLRFPDSPLKFQKGLLAIIKEEQQHLQLYIDGAAQLGVALGSLPVNRFFWDALSNMRTPYEFIVGMGLTFEQANLDHALYYMTAFRKVGDEESATLLEQVYEDEIRHVRHANYWFQQWKNPQKSDFENHRDTISFPLTPARAMGKIFDREGRRHSGLSEVYIEELRVFRHSKGRVPDVYIFNMGCEFRLMFPSKTTLPKPILQREEWWDLMMIPFVKDGDILIVHKLPTPKHLQKLQKAGFVLPQFVLRDEMKQKLSHRTINELKFWGYDSSISALQNVIPVKTKRDSNWDQSIVASKIFSKKVLDAFCSQFPEFSYLEELSGKIANNFSEALAILEQYAKIGIPSCLGKSNIGSAGRGNKIISLPLDKTMKGWLERTLKIQPIIIQPKLDKIADLSLQIYIETSTSKVQEHKKNTAHRNLGLTRFFTTPKGDYQGHHLGTISSSLPKGALRPLYDHQMLDKIYRHVVCYLQEEGFYGYAGIDMMLYRNQDGDTCIHPLIEINPRYTMGHVALHVQKRIRGIGRLCFLSPMEAQSRDPKFEKKQLIDGILQLTSQGSQIVCIEICHHKSPKETDS